MRWPTPYLLYFFAAREGLAAASLALGSQADPATRDPPTVCSRTPIAPRRTEWYQMAVQRGDTGARDRLADLHARARRTIGRRRHERTAHFALMA